MSSHSEVTTACLNQMYVNLRLHISPLYFANIKPMHKLEISLIAKLIR